MHRTAARATDRSQADDLAQEALLVTLLGRGPRGDRRRWLAGVLRNLARMDRRGRTRRARREAAAVRRGATPSAAHEVERAELRGRVRAAVEALPDPVRRAVCARHLEGRTCASLARAEGVPESTIRNRVRRGLMLLRARLAREYDGDPRTLLLALVPCRRRHTARAALAAGVLGLLTFAWPANAASPPDASVGSPVCRPESQPEKNPIEVRKAPAPDPVVVP